MRVVITGGAGFLGMRVAQAILKRGALTDASGKSREVSGITLIDMVAPTKPIADARVKSVVGDIASAGFFKAYVERDTDSIFHLAAVVSGQAEADFDIGMRVNVDATRALLERCRELHAPPKMVFTSSIAVFGGALPAALPDSQIVTPQGSYGMQKAVGELMVSDMSRKGFIDGRALRLPTVTVRPGKPNKAASSFASGMIREPLAGEAANVPVGKDTRMWVQSPARVVENILLGHEAPMAQFPTETRAVSVPGISVTVGEMAESLRRVAGDAVANRLTWNHDPVIDKLVRTWAGNFEAKRGLAMGMKVDANFDNIVRAHMEDMR
jgi:D-erythronate 2-dehydrogenase